jgi:ubiquinone/menaquinone biosynthesis C-methylase UbiE
MSVWTILLGIVLLAVAVAAILRVHSLLRPEPFPPWLTLRGLFFSRDRTLERSGVGPGLCVLEVGPGSGYLTEPAARLVGADGQLVCLDLQIEMLRKVRARTSENAPALVRASGSELPFRDGSFDLVFMVTVLGEIPDKRQALREFGRVLRAGGRLAVTEALPDPDYIRAPVLRRLATGAGFEPRERSGSWLHYTQVFMRP